MRRTPLKRNAPRYKSRKTSDGFDSAVERDYFHHLKMLEQAGEISDLQKQVTVRLHIGRSRYMKPDFRYFDNRLGETVWDEYKGYETEMWRIKRDLWAAYGPGLYRVTRQKRGVFEHFLEIRPNPKPEFVEAVIRAAGIDTVNDIIETITEVTP